MPPSRASSVPVSRTTSRSRINQVTDIAEEECDVQANATANQLEDSECWACLPKNRSQNRASTAEQNSATEAGQNPVTVPRYGAARHYPVMPPRYGGQQNRSDTDIKMVDRRRTSAGGVRKTARGALPGFQPCSDYLLGETVGDVDYSQETATKGASNLIRVRRRTPPRGKSNRAVVDIQDCGPVADDDDEEDSFEDEEYDDDGAMVGPKGNVLAMPFREGAVGVRRSRAGQVDPMYFDEGHCSNQSNSFGVYGYDGPCSDVEETNTPSRRRRRRGTVSRRSVHRKHNVDVSDSDEDEGDTENNDSDIGGIGEQEGNGLESAENDEAANDDDDDYDGNGGNGGEFIRRPQRHPSRRRTRRFPNRRSRCSPRDDGYSSTGRLSESDAGGRSRDPLSMEAATKQAQRNFYSRQTHQYHDPYATPPTNPTRPQGRVRRQDLVDLNAARKGHQNGPGIILSPHSAAPGTPPVVYSNCPSPSQHRFEPLKSSSPFTVAPVDNQRLTSPNYYQPEHALQQQKQQPRNFLPGVYQSHKDHKPHDQQLERNHRDASFEENCSRRDTSNSRRPRSSLQGWDHSFRIGAHTTEQNLFAPIALTQDHRGLPSRKQKVKGILKKTSAYGSSHSAYNNGWNSGDGRARHPSTNGYGYTPRRPTVYPSNYMPPAYDQFVV
ncbi:hypothetical protein ElyMa_004342000 [Elysia marginata]|uniref:Uncharacterized protein n=1 Tax=Elysia marginata TaxID=1093978 RepID=A0AAV4H4M5_9GAST|nr:hypothetical protein ElyMa_004342000 [Elysia marginata]